MGMQPVKREGKILTYVSGISGFDENRLEELNQTRCELLSWYRYSRASTALTSDIF
jgi:hypothetical protein